MNTRLKVTLAVAAATAVAGGGVAATVSSARAATTGTGTVATSGVSLSVNDAPRLQSNRKGWVRPGQRVQISCQAYGDNVDGKWGPTTLWDYVDGVGYASDGWLDTGTNGRIAGVPLCGEQGPTKPAARNTGVVSSGGVPLSVNDAPRLQSNRKGWVQSGETITIKCQVEGDSVNGAWGPTRLWDYIDGRGYVSDGWVDTGTNGRLAGVPTCSGQPQPQETQPPASTGGYQYPYTGKMHLPFAKGTGYPIWQAPGGNFTHSDKWNKYAIDFGSPTGTPVYAPGPGKVVKAGWAPADVGNGLEVWIDHGNNRCSQLLHNSALSVKVGDRVTMGQRVATSGASGFGVQNGWRDQHVHYGIVACDSGLSTEIPDTFETGRNYPLQTTPISSNTSH